jgi:uncharacterized protein (UPF0264 family)
MQLLVSVASATEARHAVEGGADLIDAKDPSVGALGAVSLDTLRQIHAAVAGHRIVTAALSDADNEERVERAAFDYGRIGVGFVKIGFAGTTDLSRVERLLAAAVRGVKATSMDRCGVVAVAYADTGGITSVDAAALVDIAVRAGATGVLLDTSDKNGPGLSRLVSPTDLTLWVAKAHDVGLNVALAGKLTAGELRIAHDAGADIVGVRGAACEDNRASRVIAQKVRSLSARVRDLNAFCTSVPR